MRGRCRIVLAVMALAASWPVAGFGVGSSAALAETGDPRLPQQWALAVTDTPPAWARTEGAGATVAVIDSGIDASHVDLVGAVAGGTGCFGTGGDPGRCSGAAADDDGHGTHVAGLIGARRNNGAGIAGVAPRASLLAVRVLAASCQPQQATQLCRATGSSSDISAGIRWATAHGADVINVSIAADLDAQGNAVIPIGDAVREAWANGVIVVVATGNDFATLMGPGYDHLPVVAVAATDRNDQHAVYSNGVAEAMWAVSAPGGAGPHGSCPDDNLISDYPGQQYKCMWGTSMAAPIASGELALLRAAGLSAPDAVARLLATVKHLGQPGRDPMFGLGRIDVGAAVAQLPAPKAPVPPRALLHAPSSRAPQTASRGARSTAAGPGAPAGAAGPAGSPAAPAPPAEAHPLLPPQAAARAVARFVRRLPWWLLASAVVLLVLAAASTARHFWPGRLRA